jgi:hypothetical protein
LKRAPPGPRAASSAAARASGACRTGAAWPSPGVAVRGSLGARGPGSSGVPAGRAESLGAVRGYEPVAGPVPGIGAEPNRRVGGGEGSKGPSRFPGVEGAERLAVAQEADGSPAALATIVLEVERLPAGLALEQLHRPRPEAFILSSPPTSARLASHDSDHASCILPPRLRSGSMRCASAPSRQAGRERVSAKARRYHMSFGGQLTSLWARAGGARLTMEVAIACDLQIPDVLLFMPRHGTSLLTTRWRHLRTPATMMPAPLTARSCSEDLCPWS